MNDILADRARQLAGQHPPRTPERRAAAMAWAALTTTRTAGAARRALATFGGPVPRADALALLGQLEQEAATADEPGEPVPLHRAGRDTTADKGDSP